MQASMKLSIKAYEALQELLQSFTSSTARFWCSISLFLPFRN